MNEGEDKDRRSGGDERALMNWHKYCEFIVSIEG
jgi:hypothetical protein